MAKSSIATSLIGAIVTAPVCRSSFDIDKWPKEWYVSDEAKRRAEVVAVFQKAETVWLLLANLANGAMVERPAIAWSVVSDDKETAPYFGPAPSPGIYRPGTR